MDGLLHCVTHKLFFERKSDRKKSLFALVIGTYCSLKSTNAGHFGKGDRKGENEHHYQGRIH